ncbi:MAG: preprotein translocase subunit SecG [Prevotellaceae bacterium]|nr:preprotein translocase subunit SecG [Prevotellaceae bacterium]
MYSLIIVLVILASILMCGIVLIQESKGGGLASSFSSSNQIMGVRKTTDFLEKATWGLAIAMVVLSVVSAAFVTKTTVEESPINIVAPAQPTDAGNVPTFPASENQAPAE